MDNLNLALLLLLGLELTIKGKARGVYASLTTNWPEALLFVVSLPVELLLSSSQGIRYSCYNRTATVWGTCVPGATAWLLLIRSFRVLRLFTSFTRLYWVIQAFAKSLATMGRFALVSTVLVYVYIVVGMQLFAGRHAWKDKEEVRTNKHWNPETFDSVGNAALSLFQIMTSNNWNDVMYRQMNSLRDSLYFVSFFFVFIVIILNVFTAVIIDIYRVSRERVEHGSLHSKSEDEPNSAAGGSGNGDGGGGSDDDCDHDDDDDCLDGEEREEAEVGVYVVDGQSFKVYQRNHYNAEAAIHGLDL